MSNLLVQNIEKGFIKKKVPVLRPGYNVRVHQKIKEGSKERIQIFEGLVVGLNAGHGSSKTFTVRKVVQGIAVEKVFPLYSPLISKIDVKKTFKVRRAKLNFMRGKNVSKRLSAKLGLLERDEVHAKKKGLTEEEAPVVEAVAEDTMPEEAEAPAEAEEVAEVVEAPAQAEEAVAEAPQSEEQAPSEEKTEEPKQE